MSGNLVSPGGSQPTGRSAHNALVLARLDLMEQKLKQVNDLELQVEDHDR